MLSQATFRASCSCCKFNRWFMNIPILPPIISQMCSIGQRSSEHVGHGRIRILASWRNCSVSYAAYTTYQRSSTAWAASTPNHLFPDKSCFSSLSWFSFNSKFQEVSFTPSKTHSSPTIVGSQAKSGFVCKQDHFPFFILVSPCIAPFQPVDAMKIG